jgi:hypothetical protein
MELLMFHPGDKVICVKIRAARDSRWPYTLEANKLYCIANVVKVNRGKSRLQLVGQPVPASFNPKAGWDSKLFKLQHSSVTKFNNNKKPNA